MSIKNIIWLVFLATACQTVTIKQEKYSVSESPATLGSIGQSRSMMGLKNDFDARTLPALHNKIRLTVEIVPFTKSLNKIYTKKARYHQSLPTNNYIDSLAQKPELVTFKIFDVSTYIGELNAEYNDQILQLLADTKKCTIISSIAVNLSKEDLDKLRLADTYYLVNEQDKKYTVALFKQGKKIESIDLDTATVIAYRLGTFCWALNDRGKSYVADIAEQGRGCNGKTDSRITEKQKAKNLYRM
jgi:hypothetical protein